MIIHLLRDSAALGELAARHVEVAMLETRDQVLGVATGSTPESTYAALSRRAARGTFRTDRLCVFALDEYIGLPRDHPQCYRKVLERSLSEPLGIEPSRIHVPTDDGGSRSASAAKFEEAIVEAGGVHVQILGIGRNGHIGFNEPGSDFHSTTRVVKLAESTRRANSRFFGSIEDVPPRAMSQGLATIMRSRRLMLMAVGAEKAEPIARALAGAVSPALPASVLQRHARLTVYLDRAAATRLDLDAIRSIATVHDWS